MTLEITEELLKRELKREEEACNYTIERFEKNFKKMGEKGCAEKTLPIMLLISKLVPKMSKALTLYVGGKQKGSKAKAKGILSNLMKIRMYEMRGMQISYIVIKTAFNQLMKRTEQGDFCSSQAVAYEIMREIERTCKWRALKEANPKRLEMLERQGKENNFNPNKLWRYIRESVKAEKSIEPIPLGDYEEKALTGMKLLEILCTSTGAFEQHTIRAGKKDTPLCLEFSLATREHLFGNMENYAFFTPAYPIMILPPRPWTSFDDGGYYNTEFERLQPSLIKKSTRRTRKHIEEQSKEGMEYVLEAINIMQNTSWHINEDVADVFKELWKNTKLEVAGLPPRDPEDERALPTPWGDDWDNKKAFEEASDENKKACKKYWKERNIIKNNNTRNESIRLAYDRKCTASQELRDEHSIYFAWNVDHRGRMYPLASGDGITPQADSVGKALLRFAKGEPLGDSGAYWLAVHGANVAGHDKISFDDRVRWVNDNETFIISTAKHPLEDLRWADKELIDKPWEFLAFCCEWTRYIEQGRSKDFLSYLPVAMDGACNGVQHLSAILKDAKGAEATCMLDLERKDLYSDVAEVLKEMLIEARAKGFTSDPEELKNEKKPKEGFKMRILKEEKEVICDIWIDNMTRKATKAPCMTSSYGVTAQGIKDQMIEYTKKNFKNYKVDVVKMAMFVTDYITGNEKKGIFQGAIEKVAPSIKQAQTCLKEWVKEIAEFSEEEITWTVPISGWKVIQPYMKKESKKIDVYGSTQSVRHKIKISKDTKQANFMKQKSGISPNFIHALDALHLQMTAKELHNEWGLTDFSFIHDSYGVHAGNCEALHLVLREKFVEIYGNYDVLEDFKKEQEEKLEITLEYPTPMKGSLDIEQVLDADYFFA